MHSDLKRLIELQKTDLRIAELTAQLDIFPRKLKEVEARVEQARKTLDTARERITQVHKERKKLELDVDSMREKVAKYKEQMLAVKTNDAYRALQHEIQTAEEEIRKVEDRVLVKMEETETLEHEIKEDERLFRETETAAKGEHAQIEAQRDAAREELTRHEAVRQELTAQVDGDLLSRYHRIARLRGGVALAEARNELCTACNVRLRPQVFSEVKTSEQVLTCDNCNRILYYVEQPVSASESA
jgi:predicted  nucleic acid-binding Zn-ribbon protein